MSGERKRDELLARVTDLLRRSGTDDAEELVRWLEHNLPATLRLSSGVRTDGIYQAASENGDRFQKYVRFFDEGVALTVTSSGNPEQVRRWLVPGAGQSEGSYRVVARTISFVSADTHGAVEFEGLVLDDTRIRLRWHSRINGNTGEDTYEFVPYS